MDEFTGVDNVAAGDARRAVVNLPEDAPLEDKIRAAMRATKNHWLLGQLGKNEGKEMRAAVAGVVLALGMEHEDSKRIIAEHQALVRVGAMLEAIQRGVRVDVESTLGDDEALPENPVGLLAIWKSLE